MLQLCVISSAQSSPVSLRVTSLKPNTHRRRRRDSTIELSRVSVGGVNTINSQLAHDCRRIRSTIWKLNTAVWRREFWSILILITFSTMTSLCRHLPLNSTGNCKLGHDCRRVRSQRRHDSIRLQSRCLHFAAAKNRSFYKIILGLFSEC